MSKYSDFLNCSIDKDFVKSLKQAIAEVKGEELGFSASEAAFELSFNGDIEAMSEIRNKSLRTASEVYGTELDNIPQHLNNVLSNWEYNATVFRGTRLPDTSSSFDIDGIHTTPCLHVASGYARGNANNSTGIGRILNEAEIGFVTSYEVSLTTKTYSNFEYEDFLKKQKPDSILSLSDLKNNIQNLANKSKEAFFVDDNGKASPAYQEWAQLSNGRKHYEVIISSAHPVKSIYMTNTSGFIKLNLDNPKISQILGRVQEAILRDFYEIIPLEDALLKINTRQENTLEEKDIIEKTRIVIKEKLEGYIHAPWEAKSLGDVSLVNSKYVNDRSHIANSRYVGSSMDQKQITYASEIEKIKELSINIYLNNFTQAKIALEGLSTTLNKEKALEQLISMRQHRTDLTHQQLKIS